MRVETIPSGKGNGISQNRAADSVTRAQPGTRTRNLGLLRLKTGVCNGISTELSICAPESVTDAVLNDRPSRRVSERPARSPA